MRVAEITEEGWLHLKHIPHLLWELPEVLSSKQAHSNLLAVSRLLQSHGAPHSALSHAAAECPELFCLQTQEIAASLDFMRRDLKFSPLKVAEALEKGGPMLLRGAESFAQELADALGGLTWDEVTLLLERQPSLFGTSIEHAKKITKLLTAEGLTSEELQTLIKQHPGILKQRPADIRMKLALVTRVLGHKVNAVLGSPFLVFAKSITGNSGPRFSFVRKYLPEKGTHWAPSTLLRSTDKDFARMMGVPLQKYLTHKRSWQEEHRRRQRTPVHERQ
ncbi:hypothetical protein CVIRNUC_005321 [Coccomyxa viridis]|uniref:Uncharacterized protein n=1 Tax=Coccomyxa viridis TaxID=1274662 RepID=A0AAV1I8I8_9CHLO|nr:hypothetical protein CVIRNUC_005321 [Coccomyxa viridis]